MAAPACKDGSHGYGSTNFCFSLIYGMFGVKSRQISCKDNLLTGYLPCSIYDVLYVPQVSHGIPNLNIHYILICGSCRMNGIITDVIKNQPHFWRLLRNSFSSLVNKYG